MFLSPILKKNLKALVNSLGLDITQIKTTPCRTLLGLCEISFKTIIDIGANTGQFAKEISKFFPHGKIYCFEPLPGPFKILSEWSETQAKRVVTYNCAIGNTNSEVKMFMHVNHHPSSSLLKNTTYLEKIYPFTKNKNEITVRQSTLDSVMDSIDSEIIPELLIKVDVQGYEDRVIKGGLNTFSRATACIIEVSLDPLYESQTKFKDLMFLMSDLGFIYSGNLNQTYADDGHCIFLDAVFKKPLMYYNNNK